MNKIHEAINPGNENIYGQRTSNFEESEAVQSKLDPKLNEIFNQINKGDLGIPFHALKAGAFQYDKKCGEINKEFMLCKREEGDPRKCLEYNVKVTDCATDFYKTVSDACTETFVDFAQCLEHNIKRSFKSCRMEQYAFDNCLFTKLGYDKSGRRTEESLLVETNRPEPENPLNLKSRDPQPLMPDFNRKLNLKDLQSENCEN